MVEVHFLEIGPAPAPMAAVSYVTVATHRDSYVSTRKECKRLQQEFASKQFGVE